MPRWSINIVRSTARRGHRQCEDIGLPGVATFALIASLLYLGAGILVPLVLATLLAFALTPLVTSLNRRLHLPDPLAVIVAVALALAVLGFFAYVAGTQIVNLTQELPGYQQIILTKVAGLRAQFGENTLFEQINSVISSVAEQTSGNDADAPRRPGEPIPVTISNQIGPVRNHRLRTWFDRRAGGDRRHCCSIPDLPALGPGRPAGTLYPLGQRRPVFQD
ncbi:AI-2E family transporter (plasmid) [Devosia sp. A8/3-2]|nr:AI-2E family transporter [Devosia sp. A8/3-2]